MTTTNRRTHFDITMRLHPELVDSIQSIQHEEPDTDMLSIVSANARANLVSDIDEIMKTYDVITAYDVTNKVTEIKSQPPLHANNNQLSMTAMQFIDLAHKIGIQMEANSCKIYTAYDVFVPHVLHCEIQLIGVQQPHKFNTLDRYIPLLCNSYMHTIMSFGYEWIVTHDLKPTAIIFKMSCLNNNDKLQFPA